MEAEMDRRGSGKGTISRRESFANELTLQYGSKYRDLDNTRGLMGKLQPMGEAVGIIALCMLGQICLLKKCGMRIV